MLVTLVAIAAALTPEPAASAMEIYRERTRALERCGASGARGEIVVCARRPSVYRLPFREPESGSRAAIAANAYEERKQLHGRAVDAGGIGSCSAVGPGGATGCTKGINLVAPARRLLKAVDILD